MTLALAALSCLVQVGALAAQHGNVVCEDLHTAIQRLDLCVLGRAELLEAHGVI